jgi:hypothetical protein
MEEKYIKHKEYISKQDLDLLNFYRGEIKHEFSLLSMRLNLLITCQSFLVVPFAILNNVSNFKIVAIPQILVIVLGAYTSWLSQKPLSLTQKLIREWLVKQRILLKKIDSNEYKNSRDILDNVEKDTVYDYEHEQSIAFSKQAPSVFLVFWILGFIWTLFRIYA